MTVQAPPPKTQSQSQVNKPVQGCPLQAEKPCDIDKLEVDVEIQGEDESESPRKLAVTKKRLTEAVTDVKSSAVVALLKRYDMVIDVCAGYTSREDAYPKNRLKIKAKIEPHGRECPVQQHPMIVVKPFSADGKKPKKMDELPPEGIVVKGTSWGPKGFLALSFGPDMGIDQQGLGLLFGIIRSLWPLSNPNAIEIRGDSCGKKSKAAGTPPNHSLTCLVRIFRKDVISIGIKLPPLGSYKHERSGTVTGEKEFERKTEYQMGNRSGESGKSGHGEGRHANFEQYDERWRGASGTRTETSREDHGWVKKTESHQYSDRQGAKIEVYKGNFALEVREELKKKGPIALVIKRNDREFEKELFGGEGGGKKALVEKILDGLVKAAEAISKGIEVLQKAPQLGWKFSFSISLLAGSIALEWQPRYQKGPIANGRYYPVGLRANGKIGMEVVNLSASISFGIEAVALGTGLVVKVTGTASLKVPLDCEIQLEEWRPKFEVFLKPQASIEAVAKGYATVLGYTLVDAQVSAALAFSMDDGKLEITPHRAVELKGHLKREDVEIKGYLNVPVCWWTKRKKIDPPIVVYRGAIIHTFG
jgi:hypothetical protein